MSAEPRTRRQLREALAQAVADREAAEHRVSEHEVRLESHKYDIEVIAYDLARAQTALEKAGFRSATGAPRVGRHGTIYPTTWQAPTLTLVATQEALNAPVDAAIAETRRATLQAVIDGLELREYGYRSRNEYPQFFINADADRRPGTERLWSDLTAALEVRAEMAEAEERKATEAKVAGISRRPNGSAFFISGDTIGLDPAFPRVSDLLGGVNLSSPFGPSSFVSETESSTPKKPAKPDTASKSDLTDTAKKPAKKKSEGKK